ncbi:EAL domain-containing protein [Magnetospirillum sp. SS-4]|uniref:sensor domain-containing phosphodiesterase n=1 Tax=Magnetospirillum sp. SS-4 TaxID=2681465 RepID=UPI001381DEF1|nr:EAL domain-containing protein [Magnetospirillum sp. SS-4]CAA7626236.1 Predicted signal transduction protein containing sensor and EAL domains [Magnetospirillum sp. SS-4]
MADGDHSLVEKLKQQRDRFIAFAFAGADLLLELDDSDVVTYSAGAGEALYGISDGELLGRPLADFIMARDRKKFTESVLRLRNTGRLDHTPLTMVGASGAVSRMRLAGIKLPQFPTGYHLVLSRVPPVAEAPSENAPATDPKVRFVEMVQQRLNEANRIGEDYTLTLFDLSGSNFTACEPAILQSFFATIHHALEQCSVRQSSAGPLHDRAFGLVHDKSISAGAVHQKVNDVVRQFGGKVKGANLKMQTATLEMDDKTLSQDDIGKALTFIIGGFIRDSARFAITSLAEGAAAAVEDTLVRVRNFRKMVKGESLVFLYQPMVNIATGGVLAYEAFGRIAHAKGFFNPSQIIPFATDVGVIGEFDLIAVKKALATMKSAQDISSLASIAVNVSGTSLGNPAFYHALLKILELNKPCLSRLVLEITDAARIYNLDEARRLLARIKRMGVRLSLDDFGSGGSAFDILKILPVDYVKIDSSYIFEAREKRGRSVLRALTGLTHDLGMTTIAECVEDSQMMAIIQDVGIEYAQGYLFSPPSLDAAKRIKYYKDHLKAAEHGAAAE